jgi:hypothetical protein
VESCALRNLSLAIISYSRPFLGLSCYVHFSLFNLTLLPASYYLSFAFHAGGTGTGIGKFILSLVPAPAIGSLV